ncbi:MAG: hypothetical protein J2P27_11925, partial [Actinobacteria bacterium]|nr:hypothetical protein [Actinomycetota bacterium]
LNRGVLAARGVALPGYERRDHVRARRDLLDERRKASDVADPWAGEWDVLAGQAVRAPAAAVISDELLAACTPAQVERAVRSLSAAEIHVVLTLRALPELLPADWQEEVKCGATLGWHAWLKEIVGAESAPDRRQRTLFWAAHDTLTTLQFWTPHVPADRVHVITTPGQRSPELLWARLATVLGVDPDGIDLSQAQPNSSLGYAETEFLRRVNERLVTDVPDWFYTRNIKRILALDALRDLPLRRRPALPPEIHDWAAQQAERLVAGLREYGCHVVGDLSELLPGSAAGPGGAEEAEPAEMVDAAVTSAVALADELYRRMYPTRPPREPSGGPRQAVRQTMWRMLHGPSTLWLLRRASRLRSVRRLRVAIWCLLVRPGRYQAPSLPASAELPEAGSL